jgi:hypothetical protein
MENSSPGKTARKRKVIMKLSPWWLAGAGALVVLGLVGLAFGFLQPGWPELEEAPEGGGKSVLAELKQKTGEFSGKLGELEKKKKGIKEELSQHRVFVSRTLVFFPKDAEPVKPLDPEQITEDGIQVGWKLKYGLSPEDPDVAQQDEDQDGFTNLEEYEKKSDPKDPASSPSKWVKLKIVSVDSGKMSISFSGKSEGRYTLRFKSTGKPRDVDVELGDKLWVIPTAKGIDVVKNEDEAKAKAGGTNACPHAIPLMVKEYKDDKGKRLDERTKTENEYDDSMLILQRMDEIKELIEIKIDERGKSRGVEWNVGDVRLISLVPGEGEMGPYRVGQGFAYAGKTFVVIGATPQKVTLRMKPEGELVDLLPKEILTKAP